MAIGEVVVMVVEAGIVGLEEEEEEEEEDSADTKLSFLEAELDYYIDTYQPKSGCYYS
jgi:hypothetical protein